MRFSALPLILLHAVVNAQHAYPGKLLLNPGFEEYDNLPQDWFYTGDDFTAAMKYWESPTGASPDIYGPSVYVPRHWRDKGFGQGRAHGGNSMIGLTVYGCHGGKPHCREYVQAQLVEQLVPGQRYEISYWVRHLPNSLQINNLGVAFSTQRFATRSDEMLIPDFVLTNREILVCSAGQWLRCRTEFYAESDAGYLLIGNFTSDEETKIRARCPGDCLTFAYYYIDDVSLRKLPPVLPVPVAEDDLSKVQLTEGGMVRLNYIFFDSGKADFLPRSFGELNTLYHVLKERPSMIIEIHGHTDNLGTSEFNQQLSLERAQNVVQYLTGRGIDPSRLSSRGFAESQPISDNFTEEGRSRNRRVEFHIVRM